jgi:hypothetical protein
MDKDRAKRQIAAVLGAVLGVVTGYALGKPLLAIVLCHNAASHHHGRHFHCAIGHSVFSEANALEAIHALRRLRFNDFGLPAGRYDDDWHIASGSDSIT